MGKGYLPANAEEWRRWGLRGLLFLALVVVTWPVAGVTPSVGIDPSWVLGLAMAVSNGLVWGRDIVFTYGPLGYSVNPWRSTPARCSRRWPSRASCSSSSSPSSTPACDAATDR